MEFSTSSGGFNEAANPASMMRRRSSSCTVVRKSLTVGSSMLADKRSRKRRLTGSLTVAAPQGDRSPSLRAGQAVVLVHTGHAGFGAPVTVGVVQAARWAGDAFVHGVANPRQFAHRQVDARDAVGHARDDVVHGEGIGEEVQINQAVVVGQTKPISRQQRHIGQFTELNDLDAPFLEQRGLKVMQAGAHVEDGVSLVREVQRDVEGESGSPSATVTIVVSDVFLKPMVKDVVCEMLVSPSAACVWSTVHSPAK